MAMAETQHDHRMGIEGKVIDSNISAQKVGTILGFVIVMTTILGGIYLIHAGKETSGLTSIISALVALAGVFVYGKNRQNKELAEKNKPLSNSR